MDRVKKYILPALLFIMIFVMIPKEAYYRKDYLNIKIVATGEMENGDLYLNFSNAYEWEKLLYPFKGNGNLEDKISNVIPKEYKFFSQHSKSEIKEVIFYTENKIKKIQILNGKNFDIPWKNIEGLYSFSFKNLIFYLLISTYGIFYYFKRGIKFTEKNIMVCILGMLFLSLMLNLRWFAKLNGTFFALSFLKFLLNGWERKNQRIEIVLLILLSLGMISEYVSFGNYAKNYRYFQNSLMVLLAVKVWKFDCKERVQLKNILILGLFLCGAVNLLSPLPMNGLYSFTFGIFMSILIGISLDALIFNKVRIESLIMNGLGLCLGTYGLISSTKRTMMVALAIYGLYIIAKLLEKNRKKALILIGSGILLVGIGIKVFFNREDIYKIKELVVSIANTKTDESNLQRLLMWKRGYYIAKENPFLGIGVDSFYEESQKEKYLSVKDEKENFLEVYTHVHNEYLHQIITRGIFGALIFYGLWSYILYKMIKRGIEPFEMMLMILYGIYGIFDPYTVRGESMIFYSFVGTALNERMEEKTKIFEILSKLGYLAGILIFIVGLVMNKRFRYYFLVALSIYAINYMIKRKRGAAYEKI